MTSYMNTQMFMNAQVICEECGVETQVEDDDFYFILDHEYLDDFKVRVVHLFVDSKDGKWTLVNVRPNMTGTPLNEAYVGCDSFYEGVTYALVFFFNKRREFERVSARMRGL